VGIGLTPAKSKTLGKLYISRKYFVDFLRGYFDGDGCSFSYYDPVFPKSFRFYVSFISASPSFLNWLREEIRIKIGINGHLCRYSGKDYIQLRYAKKEAIVLSNKLYYRTGVPLLRRKHKKVKDALRIIKHAQVA
jgi:hypothetical protein